MLHSDNSLQPQNYTPFIFEIVLLVDLIYNATANGFPLSRKLNSHQYHGIIVEFDAHCVTLFVVFAFIPYAALSLFAI